MFFVENPLPSLLSNAAFEQTQFVLFCAFSWTLLYVAVEIYFRGKPNTPEHLDTKNRIVSIVHGLLSLILSSVDVFVHKCSLSNPTTDY